MVYVVFNKNGVVGYTESKEVVDKIVNVSWAEMMGYRVETRAEIPSHLDRLA